MAKCFRFGFALALITAMLSSVVLAAVYPKGIEISRFPGASIFDVYLNPAGTFVILFNYKEAGQVRLGFYDAAADRYLAQADAAKMATDNAAFDKFVTDSGLKRLSPDGEAVTKSGVTLSAETVTGSHCGRPYDRVLTIGKRKFVIFVKSPKPITETYSSDCSESSGGSPPLSLTTRYWGGQPVFYRDGHAGLFLATEHFPGLIELNANGGSAFFRHRADVVMVALEKVGKFLEGSERGSRSEQNYIDKIESVVKATAVQQMEESR